MESSRPLKTNALDVLDYGCGHGVGTMVLKHDGWQVIGVDSDRDAIRFAKDVFGHLCKYELDNWLCDAARFTPEAKFDLVTCIEVIEHVRSPKRLVLLLARAMKADGFAVISTLNHNSQYRKNDAHVGKFHVADFREVLQTAFRSVNIVEYTLNNSLDDESTITPVVAVCQGKIAAK